MNEQRLGIVVAAFAFGAASALADDSPTQSRGQLETPKDRAKMEELQPLTAVPPRARPVDLDVPANLEAVERTRPAHYAKIQRILQEVRTQPVKGVATWMRTEFDAQNVTYTPLVLYTSIPPKARLAFTLDGTSYVALIRLGGYVAP